MFSYTLCTRKHSDTSNTLARSDKSDYQIIVMYHSKVVGVIGTHSDPLPNSQGFLLSNSPIYPTVLLLAMGTHKDCLLSARGSLGDNQYYKSQSNTFFITDNSS